MQKSEIVINTDGGARGNPGPAASAFVVRENGEIIKSASRHLGKKTNNYAEYQGVILALTWLSEKKLNDGVSYPAVNFILDSELVVRQLNGLYKVKEETLKKLFREVMGLIKNLDIHATFKNVPRSQNKDADFLVNEELDRAL